ncbi:hypothetical protein HDA32_005154 [Spinactinospora alkalitolerans]|uniref:DUF397 domain-containing protein n=1 Tax=Spinactinospora alkalitolerans TaxID=687207 RepID=A0A852U7J1_9ACTN|nr:DUF397 domain-containing protein [Spinactinospora alkalitolerans]NYE50034.1 hypothetical protein [Spinactinospora alkalitolerans]
MTTDRTGADLEWRKATASQGSSGCVEIAHTDDGTLVRDSKNPDAGHLFFTPHEWACFLDGAAKGEFHHG